MRWNKRIDDERKKEDKMSGKRRIEMSQKEFE